MRLFNCKEKFIRKKISEIYVFTGKKQIILVD